MLNPDLRMLLKGKTSRYSLVTATAKRARIIVEEAQQNNEILVEKAVSIAVNQLLNSEYRIVEPKEIRNL